MQDGVGVGLSLDLVRRIARVELHLHQLIERDGVCIWMREAGLHELDGALHQRVGGDPRVA